MPPDNMVPPGAPFAFEVGSHALEGQLRRIDSLDTKSGIVVAADGVLAGLLFSSSSPVLRSPRPLAMVALAALMVSLLLGLLAFANRRYETAPNTRAVVHRMARDDAWLKWRFLGNLLEALETNARKLAWKARFLTGAIVCLMLAVGLAGGYLFYGLMKGGMER